jgi:hypothetical protein
VHDLEFLVLLPAPASPEREEESKKAERRNGKQTQDRHLQPNRQADDEAGRTGSRQGRLCRVHASRESEEESKDG